jgi:hypothetical protein
MVSDQGTITAGTMFFTDTGCLFCCRYFHSVSLLEMRTSIQGPFTCGTEFAITGALPTVTTKATCEVPKGNYVQLDGRVDVQSGPVWYAWDRVDPGPANYNDLNIPRFVPHFPTQRSSKRFLPNMYLLSFGLGTQKEEIPPKANVAGDTNMIFRLIARTRFDTTATVANFDASLAGTFGFQDMALIYRASVAPLTITATGNFETTKQVTVNWTGGNGLTNFVELMIAINTMPQVLDFDYEKDVVDLNWISMGVFPNIGTATATVPTLNPGLQPINFMIRSKDTTNPFPDDCYFFDMKTVPLVTCTINCAPVAAPVATPVSAPVAAPVALPVATPIATPVLLPVSTPVAPVAAPIATPVATPVSAPVAPVLLPVSSPVMANPAPTTTGGGNTSLIPIIVGAILSIVGAIVGLVICIW